MDSKQLEAAYLNHKQGLYLLALAITRCPAAAEDAVHDAFARMHARRGAPAGDGTAYVFAAVRNAAVDHVRGRRGESPAAASLYNGHAPSPEDSALAAERDRILRQAVDGLPLDQQEALVLRVYAGLSFEQIAEVAGAPLPTVFSRYQRALEKLRDRLRSLS
ncbi:MAG: sigma-70 family RNA polymerase sigma factor [Planctomycetota bacterium]|nr:sigma-70 family RNA polymerase sigma factor [Planctomycetota bacterium]